MASRNKYSGKKFDHEYVKEMIKNHKEDIKDFKAGAKDAKDPDVRSWASNHISALEASENGPGSGEENQVS
jgi:putative membrane protein